ncbi:MAG: hypothetical protein HC886_12265 [Leptolyngbyaceae cyanobacterium SM1_1_3]|nr:hypothetical protein [Leptolyngbyaceae cyanobacterium SM1_1_3]
MVAIIIIGLTVSAVTPALIISVASRVQSQKAAQALEACPSRNRSGTNPSRAGGQ